MNVSVRSSDAHVSPPVRHPRQRRRSREQRRPPASCCPCVGRVRTRTRLSRHRKREWTCTDADGRSLPELRGECTERHLHWSALAVDLSPPRAVDAVQNCCKSANGSPRGGRRPRPAAARWARSYGAEQEIEDRDGERGRRVGRAWLLNAVHDDVEVAPNSGELRRAEYRKVTL